MADFGHNPCSSVFISGDVFAFPITRDFDRLLCVPSCPLWLRVCFSISAIFGNHGNFGNLLWPPPGLFFSRVENKGRTAHRPKGDPCVTLGWRLGGPWATLGPPNPKPNQAEGRRRASPKYQLLNTKYVFWPFASC